MKDKISTSVCTHNCNMHSTYDSITSRYCCPNSKEVVFQALYTPNTERIDTQKWTCVNGQPVVSGIYEYTISATNICDPLWNITLN